MNEPTKTRQVTRREFVGGALTAAGVLTGAPALLRGRNLNDKLNIAFIACGGRALDSISELVSLAGTARDARAKQDRRGEAAPAAPHPDENVTVLCDVDQKALDAASQRFPRAPDVHRPPARFRQAGRLRCRRRVHGRAHARNRDLPGADARQARLLREAVDLQHLGSAGHSGNRRQVSQAVDADGQPGPRLARTAHDRGNPPDRRHRPGARSPRVGGTRVGTAGCGVRAEVRQAARVLQRHPDCRTVQGGDAGPANPPFRSVARTCPGTPVPCDVLPRAALVSLVGFRQRHDERPWQP